MRKAKLIRQLKDSYGKPPDVEYFEEDLRGIRAYADYRKEKGLDPFYVDDTTWNDLSMEAVFKRVNAAQSTAGEQALYYWLRCPAMDQAAWDDRQALVGLMERDGALRLSLQMLLQRLGKWRAANTREAFRPSAYHSALLPIALLLVLALLSSFAVFFLLGIRQAALAGVLLFFVNQLYHTYVIHKLQNDLATVNYSVSMVAACRRLLAVQHPELSKRLSPLREALRRCRPLLRIGGVSFVAQNDLVALLNNLLMVDLIAYELLKRKLGRYHREIFAMQEGLGAIDAAIAVASYRASLTTRCIPKIDFSREAKPFFCVKDLKHPLLHRPVPNSLDARRALLLTGSNASGKSTFLKAGALCALLSQSLCTAPAERYAAASFHIYSSMAIQDDVIAGESYFIAEIRSLKRIWDAANRGERILCVIDEVLRGTNTVERVAASSELLARLNRGNVLCLAATHDMELCALLSPAFELKHFTERIEGGEILFDYLLKDGPATSRNAIRLLSLMGFDEMLTANAAQKAETFFKTGRWDA